MLKKDWTTGLVTSGKTFGNPGRPAGWKVDSEFL